EGWDITVVPCDAHGWIDPTTIADALTDRTVLVSVMAANNEVGTLNPIVEIGELCHERGVVFHTDAAQAVSKVPFGVQSGAIDLLSISGHKVYAPKGIGVLYVRRADPPIRLAPLFDGGGHERGLRSGTLPVPLIVGLGLALEIAMREQSDEAARMLELRERLFAGIMGRVTDGRLNGHRREGLPGNLNLSFAGVGGEAVMMAMREMAVSSGSACSSANPEPSHVLLAMGLSEELARASLRFGLGRFTTAEEIDFTIQEVASTVERLRGLGVAWSARDGA